MKKIIFLIGLIATGGLIGYLIWLFKPVKKEESKEEKPGRGYVDIK